MLLSRPKREKFSTSNEINEPFPLVLVRLENAFSTSDSFEILVRDINSAGMGVVCDFPLQVGQKLLFVEDQLDWELPSVGVVMWTFQANQGVQAGIKFMPNNKP